MSSRKPRPGRQPTGTPAVRSRHAVPATMARVKLAAAALIVLGCISSMMRSTGLDDQVASGGDDNIAHDDLQLARGVVLRGNVDVEEDAMFVSLGGTNTAVVGDTQQPHVTTEAPTISTTEPPATVLSETTPLPETITKSTSTNEPTAVNLPRLSTPAPTTRPAATQSTASLSSNLDVDELLETQCYNNHDFGLIKRAARPSHVFCDSTSASNSNATPQTQVAVIDAPSGIRAVLFTDLVLDLTSVKTSRPIKSLAQDGGDHDPRFVFNDRMIYCSCTELRSYADKMLNSQPFNLWDRALSFRTNRDNSDASLVCSGSNTLRPVDMFSDPEQLLEFSGRVVLIPRRDDHNPFFQVSSAFNTWIMLQALKWDRNELTVIHLDDGYPSPVDELHEKLLSPARKIVNGTHLMGKKLILPGQVMLSPFEAVGPMMQHLDDFQPCSNSALYQEFRSESLRVMKASPSAERDTIIVTFISRKVYNGRRVQRRWLNEDEVVSQLQQNYQTFGGKKIVFQSIDFVALPLGQQMQLMLDSDVVVSMHGAGLVNVLWTRPGTLVIEIFPFSRKRWGYRNICQFVGCKWHEFRGGRDIRTGFDANANDKIIAYEVWRSFFDPLFQSHLLEIIPSPTVTTTNDLNSATIHNSGESLVADSPAFSLPPERVEDPISQSVP